MRTLIILASFLLVACAAPQATLNTPHVPVNTCTVSQFGCFVIQDGNNDVGLALQNNLGFEISSVVVTLNTTSCTLEQSAVTLGSLPKGAGSTVHFTCTTPVPAVVSGKILLQYENKGETKTLLGTLSMKS